MVNLYSFQTLSNMFLQSMLAFSLAQSKKAPDSFLQDEEMIRFHFLFGADEAIVFLELTYEVSRFLRAEASICTSA